MYKADLLILRYALHRHLTIRQDIHVISISSPLDHHLNEISTRSFTLFRQVKSGYQWFVGHSISWTIYDVFVPCQ